MRNACDRWIAYDAPYHEPLAVAPQCPDCGAEVRRPGSRCPACRRLAHNAVLRAAAARRRAASRRERPNRDLLTVAEAARVLGLSVRAIQARLRRGVMRGERFGARIWLIPRAEVEAWSRQPPGGVA